MTFQTRDLGKMADAVAFDTEHPGIAADEKKSIGRSVGNMTDRTAFHLASEMFVDPRPPLFGMALEADIRSR